MTEPQTILNAAFSLRISPKYAGLTLFEFLSARFPFFSVPHWHDVLAEGSVCINDQTASGNPTLGLGDQLSFSLLNYYEDPVDLTWSVLWQNDELLVVYKPPQLPVQQTTRNVYYTLTQVIRRQLHLPAAEALHRLDLETAGLVLLAKTKAAAKIFQPELKKCLTGKTYQAIVWGCPAWQEKTFTGALTKRANSEIRSKMYVADETESGKASTTHFRLIKRGKDFSQIECTLETGRKHQIRAHLSHLGHPIVGDKMYAHNGEFYLKRLADAFTLEDSITLKTPHHLLVASRFELNLAGRKFVVDLPNSVYPPVWQQFVQQHLRD